VAGAGSSASAAEPVKRASQAVEPVLPEEQADAVAQALNEHIEGARARHYAFTLIAVRVTPRDGDTEAEERALRDRVAADLRQLVAATEEPDVVLDVEDDVLWVLRPGLLPRRATVLVAELDRLLHGRGMPPVTVAVAGYPRDGVTAADLLEHCRVDAERTGTRPAAWHP
jgi:hypothetical protein